MDEPVAAYSGSFSPTSIDRQQFEQLLEQWICNQAKCDGCPIHEGRDKRVRPSTTTDAVTIPQ